MNKLKLLFVILSCFALVSCGSDAASQSVSSEEISETSEFSESEEADENDEEEEDEEDETEDENEGKPPAFEDIEIPENAVYMRAEKTEVLGWDVTQNIQYYDENDEAVMDVRFSFTGEDTIVSSVTTFSNEYNDKGQVIKTYQTTEQFDDGISKHEITESVNEYQYNDHDQVSKMNFLDMDLEFEYEYDEEGRPIVTYEKWDGKLKAKNVMEYDSNGDVVKKVLDHIDSDGNISGTQSIMEYTYDEKHRELTVALKFNGNDYLTTYEYTDLR